MHYIVLDLEWNQAMSSKSSVFNYLPIHLGGEIIEIGAVRLNEDFTPGEEFTIDVKPVYFRKIHYKVKKITGFDKERLEKGVSFPEALDTFRKWCGDGATFLTWGSDDRRIMEQNIIIHDLDWDWIEDWINLQIIYNIETASGRSQKSLAAAMEHFGIEQTRVAHDALGDAYNTALICSHLNMPEGIRQLPDADRILSRQETVSPEMNEDEQDGVLSHECFSNYSSKAEVFSDEKISCLSCPVCGKSLSGRKWINQGDQRYMNLYTCSEDGSFLVRIRFRRETETNTWFANRIVYEATTEMEDYYKTKSTLARRRGRGHKNRKTHLPAK